MNKRVVKTLGVIGCVLLSVAGAFLYVEARSVTSVTEQWLPIEPAPLVQRLGLVGRIEPGTLLTLTAPFEGIVEDTPAEEGQRVERGQRLLRLDTGLLQIQLRDARAELLKAERAVQDLQGWNTGQDMVRARRALSNSQLTLNDTERKLKETRLLLERGIVPRMDLDALEQQAQVQRLDLRAAEAELKDVESKGRGEHRQIADMQLENANAKYLALRAQEVQCDISAPFAGIIVRQQGNANDGKTQPLQQGARVSQGQGLFGLANLEQLKVVAKVDESDINQLRVGLPVDITGDGFGGVLLNGRITAVGSQVQQAEFQGNGASYEVAVSLPALTPEQQQRIRLGMSARLSIITYQNPAAIVVPFAAINEHQGQQFVSYRRSPEKPAKRVDISLGQATSEGVEVFGLFPGFIRTSGEH